MVLTIGIIGSTAGVGLQALRVALNRQHKVVALARTPSKLDSFKGDSNLTVIKGDACDAQAVENVVQQSDVILTALGHKSDSPKNVVETGNKNVISALQKLGKKRLIVCTAAGMGNVDDAMLPWFYKNVLKPTVLSSIYADMEKAEEAIKTNSAIEWTLVHPPRLVDNETKGELPDLSDRYVTQENTLPDGNMDISREEVGYFMVVEAEQNQWVNKVVGINRIKKKKGWIW